MTSTAFASGTVLKKEWLNGVDEVVCSVLDLRFGAKGDGVTDDTAAIQAALDTGCDVFLPATSAYYKISAALNMQSNQRLYGVGDESYLYQVTSLANTVVATSKTKCVVENLKIRAPGTKSGLIDGSGVAFVSSTYCTARNVTVINHLGAGVNLYNTSDSLVEYCVFKNSPATDGALNNTVGADVQVVYNSSRNTVQYNQCISGNSVGVYIQTVTPGDICDDNQVLFNYIKDCKAYGAMAYRNDDAYPSADSVRRTKFIGNTIINTTGTIINSVTSTYTYGTAIYIQGAEETEAVDNIIKGTHTGAVTFAETLAPGAIGATNQTRVKIQGNLIQDAGMFGIDVGDSNNFGEPTGMALVDGNQIVNSQRAAIHIRRRGRVTVSNNTIDTVVLDSGIEVNNIVLASGITIVGNYGRNIGGNAGVELKYAGVALVAHNYFETLSAAGITADNSPSPVIKGNTILYHTTRGVQVTSSCSNADVSDNFILGNGTSQTGIRLDSSATYSGNNISGCVDAWFGTYSPWQTLTVNSTTPSVSLNTKYITANSSSTTITNFTNGKDGQVISILINDANTILDFTGSNLRGNAGSNRTMNSGDMVHATFYGEGVNVWYCTIVAGS